MARTLYIHVGPPKTASTYLQNALKKAEGIKSVVKPEETVGDRRVRFSDLFFLSPEVWDDFGRDMLEVHSKPARDQDADLIISSEGIYGGLGTPRPWYDARRKHLTDEVNILRDPTGLPYSYHNAVHLERVAGVASQIGFDSTKVLVTVRRQDTKLASGYAEMSSSIVGASQENFELWIDKILTDPVGYYGLGGSKLDYFTWWKEVAKKLGKKNILLLPVELLGETPRDFLQRWIDFLDLDSEQEGADLLKSAGEQRMRTSSESETIWRLRPPPRSEASSFRVLRSAGLLSTTKRFFGWPKRDRRINLKDKLSIRILQKYKDENVNLDDCLKDISIEKYGYY